MKIAVLGAGVMGLTLAQQLLEQGYDLEVFEKDQGPSSQNGKNAEGTCVKESSAAFTAAGMLAPFSEMESAEPLIFQLGVRANALWQTISKSLGDNIDYRQAGSLIVAHPQDHAELEQYRKRLLAHIPSGEHGHLQSIDHAALKDLNPELAKRFNQAIVIPSEACLSPPLYIEAARHWLNQQSVKLHVGVEIKQVDQWAKINSGFDAVIDCRGIGAKSDLNALRGVRGETILLQSNDVSIDTIIRLMHPRYRLYLAPRRDGHYIIGATEIESDDVGPITVRSALELLSAAYSIDPAFAEATVVKTASSCRPAFPDNAPKILIKDNLLQINGLYRHGLLIAPAIAEQIVSYFAHGKNDQLLPDLFEHSTASHQLYA